MHGLPHHLWQLEAELALSSSQTSPIKSNARIES